MTTANSAEVIDKVKAAVGRPTATAFVNSEIEERFFLVESLFYRWSIVSYPPLFLWLFQACRRTRQPTSPNGCPTSKTAIQRRRVGPREG